MGFDVVLYSREGRKLGLIALTYKSLRKMKFNHQSD